MSPQKDDLISREALRNVILNDRKLDGVNANWEINRILVHIDNAPTVHHSNCDICEDKAKQYSLGFQDGYLTGKERPQGEWIRSEETFEDLSGSFETYTRSTCSICNQANGWGEVPYCPWCGAKMEVKNDKHGETDPEQTGGDQATE